MKLIQTTGRGLFTLSLLGGFTVWPTAVEAAPRESASQAPRISQVYVSEPVAADLSPALRDLPSISARPTLREHHRRIPRKPVRDLSLLSIEPAGVDPLVGQ